jgi:hypothetical protein
MRIVLLLSLWIGLAGAFPGFTTTEPEHAHAFHQPRNPSPALESERIVEVRPSTEDRAAVAPSNAATLVQTIRRVPLQRAIAVTRPATAPALHQRPPPPHPLA